MKHHDHQIQSQNEKHIKKYQDKIDMTEFHALADTVNYKHQHFDDSTIENDNDERGLNCNLDAAVLKQLYVA